MNDQPEVDWVESSDEPAPFADLTDEEFAVFAEGAGFDPAPRSDTPSDERHPGYPHQPGEPLTLDLTVDLARPAPSPVPEASGQSRDGQNQRLRALAVEAVIQEWLAEDISPCRYGAVEYDAECPWHMGEVDWPELARNIAAKLDASPAPSSSPVGDRPWMEPSAVVDALEAMSARLTNITGTQAAQLLVAADYVRLHIGAAADRGEPTP